MPPPAPCAATQKRSPLQRSNTTCETVEPLMAASWVHEPPAAVYAQSPPPWTPARILSVLGTAQIRLTLFSEPVTSTHMPVMSAGPAYRAGMVQVPVTPLPPAPTPLPPAPLAFAEPR